MMRPENELGGNLVMKCKYTIETLIGELTVLENDGRITDLHFGKVSILGMKEMKTELIEEVEKQINEYYQGKRQDYDLPLRLEGTPFQKKVWEALREIPKGETRTYEDIAIAVGNPKASRAVGMANNRNRIPVIIPCHRVIGKNGKLVGYAGGLDVKARLLAMEKKRG